MDEPASIEDRIVAAIRQVIRAVDLHSRKLVDQHGLTGPQLATLTAAERAGPIHAGALARAVQLSQPTMTGILDRLETRGLLERTRDARDRRNVVVSITDKGEEALRSAPSLLQERFRSELSHLPEWERHQILSTLQRVANMMGACPEETDDGHHGTLDIEPLATESFDTEPIQPQTRRTLPNAALRAGQHLSGDGLGDDGPVKHPRIR